MDARRCFLCLAVAGVALLLPARACAGPAVYTVVIDHMKFGPTPSQLHRGDTIIWLNRDMLRHSATAADHSFDVDLQPNARARTLLKKRGAIAIACRYHPGMRAVLDVR